MPLPENRIPTHPGEILLQEFLVSMRISQATLARRLGIPVQRVSEIARGKRSITAATAWLLAWKKWVSAMIQVESPKG